VTAHARAEPGCILCGQRPRTRAHIIARNIREVLPRERSRTTHVVAAVPNPSGMPAQSDLSTWNNGAHMLDAQPRVLCAACNNEWMNNLELVATPVVASMIRRDSMSVGTEILRSIAEWALAAAIVRAEMTNQMKSVDADLAAHFRRKGLDDLPVGVGLYRIERPVGSPVAQKIASSLIHDADNGNVPGHMIAFWLDTVGIVVNTEGFVGRGERSLRLFRSAAVRAWPEPEIMDWPPRASVDPGSVLDGHGFAPSSMPSMVLDHARYKDLPPTFAVTHATSPQQPSLQLKR